MKIRVTHIGLDYGKVEVMTNLELFRSWVNDFLSVETFAEHYGLTFEQALAAIEQGRNEHNVLAESLKAMESMSVDELAADLPEFAPETVKGEVTNDFERALRAAIKGEPVESRIIKGLAQK